MNKFILLLIVVAIVVFGFAYFLNGKTPLQNLGGGNVLDLSNKGLTQVPMDIFSRVNLVELNLSGNNFTGALPAEVRKLQNLQVLNLSGSNFTGVPAEIGQLRKLRILDLSNNKITGLPNELGNLTQLETFNISGNNYSQQDLDKIQSTLPNTTIIK